MSARIRYALEAMIEAFDEHTDIPDRNCSCHISPPCGDCEAYSFARDAHEEAKAALAEYVSGASDSLLRAGREVISQIDQGGSDGKVFARDDCIRRLREQITGLEA